MLEVFENKTAYHRRIFRLPVMLKMLSDWSVSFQKVLILLQVFWFFQRWNFPFFVIKNKIKMGMTVWRNNIIWYAFNNKIATFTDFEKKSSFF